MENFYKIVVYLLFIETILKDCFESSFNLFFKIVVIT